MDGIFQNYQIKTELGENCFSCQKKISKKDYQNHFYWIKKEGIYHENCWQAKPIKKNNQFQKVNNWEDLLKIYPCSNCDYNFTEEDIKNKNWQISYWVDKSWSQESPLQETKEIYNIKHLDCLNCLCYECQKAHEELKENAPSCFSCQKKLNNLVIVSKISETTYHPECWEQKKVIPLVYKWHTHPQLLKLKVNQTKITVYLEDKREISIPISELAKRWKKPNLKAEQLKQFEIYNGFNVRFPLADIDSDVLIFTGSNCGCC